MITLHVQFTDPSQYLQSLVGLHKLHPTPLVYHFYLTLNPTKSHENMSYVVSITPNWPMYVVGEKPKAFLYLNVFILVFIFLLIRHKGTKAQ